MIISTNKGGLANRMKSMVSVIRIAQEKKQDVAIYWPILDSYQKDNHLLNCPYSNLFTFPPECSHQNSNDEIYNSHCLYISDKDPIPPNFSTPKIMGKVKFIFNTPNLRNIDLEYNRISTEMKNIYQPYFHQLKLVPHLEEKINQFAEKFTLSTVSLHIRSWSHPNENTRQNYKKLTEYVSRYEKEMNKYPSSSFYLSTDNPDIIDYFLSSKWKNKIITYDRKTPLKNSRSSSQSIEEDLIELYLLSKNPTIIGSYGSTFTEVAWWLGNCTKNIIIV